MIRSLFRPAPAVPAITAVELSTRLSNGEQLQLVDVRERHEWNEGHIPGSVHIPLGDLQARVGKIARDRTVVMICRSGNRSYHATAALQAAGFTNVVNLDGGVIAWGRAGLRLER